MRESRSAKRSAKIQVIGCGEAFDVDLGNTSYLFSGVGYPSILFDCGYQIPERLWKAELHSSLDAVCFTHLHADHSFGIVPLLMRYWEEKRRKPLDIFGPRCIQTYVRKLFDLGYPGAFNRLGFSLRFHEFSPAKPLTWKGLKFSTARTVHSVLNLTIRVDLKGMAKSFAVSGDGQITEETMRLVEDVDLLFQEVYTAEPEVPVHADLQTVAAFVARARLKKVLIAHQGRGEKPRVLWRVSQLAKKDRRWGVSRVGLASRLVWG